MCCAGNPFAAAHAGVRPRSSPLRRGSYERARRTFTNTTRHVMNIIEVKRIINRIAQNCGKSGREISRRVRVRKILQLLVVRRRSVDSRRTCEIKRPADAVDDEPNRAAERISYHVLAVIIAYDRGDSRNRTYTPKWPSPRRDCWFNREYRAK